MENKKADTSEEEKRVAISVTLTPRARKVIDAIRDDTRIPNTSAMEMILEDFAAQDPKLRLAILVRDEQTKAEMRRLALQQMLAIDGDEAAAELAKQFSVPAAMRTIRALLARVEQVDATLRQELSEQAGAKGKSKKG